MPAILPQNLNQTCSKQLCANKYNATDAAMLLLPNAVRHSTDTEADSISVQVNKPSQKSRIAFLLQLAVRSASGGNYRAAISRSVY